MNIKTTNEGKPLSDEQHKHFLQEALLALRLNPQSTAQVLFTFENGNGAIGQLPCWGMLTKPVVQLTSLLTSPVTVATVGCVGLELTIHREVRQRWTCLVRPSTWGKDGTCGEFFVIEDKTYTEALSEAKRYLWDNSDFNAFKLIPDNEAPLPWVDGHGDPS